MNKFSWGKFFFSAKGLHLRAAPGGGGQKRKLASAMPGICCWRSPRDTPLCALGLAWLHVSETAWSPFYAVPRPTSPPKKTLQGLPTNKSSQPILSRTHSSKNVCIHCACQIPGSLRSLLCVEKLAILWLEHPTVTCLHFVSISWPNFLIFLKYCIKVLQLCIFYF